METSVEPVLLNVIINSINITVHIYKPSQWRCDMSQL